VKISSFISFEEEFYEIVRPHLPPTDSFGILECATQAFVLFLLLSKAETKKEAKAKARAKAQREIKNLISLLENPKEMKDKDFL